MKTAKHYTEEFINYLYGDIPEEDKSLYQPDITQSRADFKAGFNLAEELFKPKWISVETPPDDDREVTVYVRNHKTPWWSGNHFGSYINEKWYLKDGVRDEYEIIKWAEIPQEKEVKTIEEWGKVYNKIIILDNDGFKDLSSEEEISERDFVGRLTRCTINL